MSDFQLTEGQRARTELGKARTWARLELAKQHADEFDDLVEVYMREHGFTLEEEVIRKVRWTSNGSA